MVFIFLKRAEYIIIKSVKNQLGAAVLTELRRCYRKGGKLLAADPYKLIRKLAAYGVNGFAVGLRFKLRENLL